MEFDGLEASIKYEIERMRDGKELVIRAWLTDNIPFMQKCGIEVYKIEDVIERLKSVDKLEFENELLKEMLKEKEDKEVEMYGIYN